MSPTVVLQDDELYMVVGGSGGPTIITAVMQVLLGVLAYNEPIGEAITNPRLHNQFTNETRVESNYLPAWINSLKSKHHNINLLPPETLLASVQVRHSRSGIQPQAQTTIDDGRLTCIDHRASCARQTAWRPRVIGARRACPQASNKVEPAHPSLVFLLLSYPPIHPHPQYA